MATKRPGEMSMVPVKKAKTDLLSYDGGGQLFGPARTSSLLSPIMLLEGHQDEILTARFSPKGDILASAGAERSIFLWKVYGECTSAVMQPNHTGSVTGLKFNYDGTQIYTSSIDKTVGVWDVQTGSRIKRLKGHTNFVNCVDNCKKSQPLVVSGSDDCQVRLWDIRRRGPAVSLNAVYQVTSVSFGCGQEQIISGGIDNDIKVWDLRKADVSFTMSGHQDTITDLQLSPDGNYVLSNSMDGSLRIWDIRPFSSSSRCQKIMMGHNHGFEKFLIKCGWSPDGQRVITGSSDRFVYVFDTNTRHILYRLPGHEGTVIAVDFHPDEPIILSASADKQIYLGEIED